MGKYLRGNHVLDRAIEVLVACTAYMDISK